MYTEIVIPKGALGGTNKEAESSSVFQGIQFGRFIKL
jgi:hypothetical protein